MDRYRDARMIPTRTEDDTHYDALYIAAIDTGNLLVFMPLLGSAPVTLQVSLGQLVPIATAKVLAATTATVLGLTEAGTIGAANLAGTAGTDEVFG